MDARARKRRGRRALAARHGARGRRLGPARATRCARPRTCTGAPSRTSRRRRTRRRIPRSSRACKAHKTIAWAGWGFDAAHHRHNPQAQQRPPFTQVWGAGLDSLAEFPPVADDKGVYIETAKRQRRRAQPDDGQAPLDAPDRAAARDQPGARRAPRLRLVAGRRRGRARAARDGKRVWRYRVGARTESSPLLVDGTLYFGAEDGTLTALDARNGHRRWRVHVGGAVKGSPAYSGGLLVVGSYDGHVYAFNARTGTRRWRTSGLGRYGGLQQGHFYSTPTIAYGRVYIGSTDGRVYSLVASTGKIAWSAQTGGYVYAGPAVVHQLVLIGSYDRKFYAFNARTGARRWRFDAKARISGSATIVNDIVYFSTFGNGTFGLDVANGRQVWRRFEGRYSPVVATRDAFYFIGYSTLRRLRPRSHPAGLFLRSDGTVIARGGHAVRRRR